MSDEQEQIVADAKEFMRPVCLRGGCDTRPVVHALDGEDWLCGRHFDVFLALCRDRYEEMVQEATHDHA